MRDETLPTDVDPEISWFDKFAGSAASLVAHARFFSFCTLLIVVWAPSYFLFGNADTWQLVINTATTIITFLLVALLQNSQERQNKATQHKLNAIAKALDDLTDGDTPELSRAVGLEKEESSS